MSSAPAGPPAGAPRGAAAAASPALLVAGLVLAATAMRAPITGVGPVLPRIGDDLGLGPAAAGLLTALPLLAFAAASALVPRAAHRWGARPVLAAALLVMVAGGLLRWLPGAGAQGVAALFGGTALVGAAIAVANVLMPVLLRREFPTRVAVLTSGYVVVMGLAGSLASGTAEPVAAAAPGGWRTALALWVLPAVPAAAAWLLLARGARGAEAGAARARLPRRSALVAQVTAFMGLQSVGFYVLLAWLPTLLRDLAGLDAVRAGWELFLVQAVGMVSSALLPLLLRGRRSQSVPAAACSLLTAAGVAGLLLAPGASLLWCAVLGAGTGASVVLALSFLGTRAADAGQAAALSGRAQSVGYLLAAAGPVTAGALHEATGGWGAPLGLLLVLCLVQAAAGWAAGRPRTLPAG